MVDLKIHATIIDNDALSLIYTMKNHPAFTDLIAIMPDVHAGKNSVVGLTCKFDNAVIPNIISGDIGCGVTAYNLGNVNVNFENFDKILREKIPFGNQFRFSSEGINISKKYGINLNEFMKTVMNLNSTSFIESQFATLGGGNHFIEIAESNNEKWVIIHSGSRNFGIAVASYYQNKAIEYCDKNKISIIKGMEYLPLDEGGNDYLYDMKIAQKYAKMNRHAMLRIILDILNINYNESNIIESVHNYIGDDKICRKGAISAYKDQPVIIPLNMKDGSMIGRMKDNNKDWNFSAPHGAGRLHSRSAIKTKIQNGEITLNDFEKSMNGIYSSSITKSNIDESVFAYKNSFEIVNILKEVMHLDKLLIPLYNAKA